MSHTHRRDTVSDFSIERILAKDVAAPSCNVDRLPSSSSCKVASSEKIDWLTDVRKLQVEGSVNDRKDMKRITKDSVETIKQTPNLESTHISEELSWLRCTRYHPPKLPRKSCINKNSKRKPGTHPRIPFTKYQLDTLEEKYKSSAYLSRKDVVYLSEVLQLPQNRIKIWFQNRRARERRESQTFTQTQTSIS